MPAKVLIATYAAMGGPATPRMGEDGFPKGPTDAGSYRISHCARHVSRRYAGWSSFAWGSRVREEAGKVQVLKDGHWTDVASVGLTPDDIRDYYKLLYGRRAIPPTWVFNDFGHMTCYLYKDRNNNQRRDRDEPIHGEFIHTTPEDEASVRRGLSAVLGESHGCVHVKPTDIDEMIRKGYLRKNRPVVVHRYSETTIPFPRPTHGYQEPIELHFFPGAQALCVVGTSRF